MKVKGISAAPLGLFLMTLLVSPLLSPLRADHAPSAKGQASVEQQVRHELRMLPFYSIFDDLNYTVRGDTVTLTGKVTRPTLKSDAEAVVKRIEGVSKVDNQIEVLPLSSFDNRLRRAVYARLFNINSPLFRYGLGADPSIHIIVENGHVTLKGTVSNQSDKNIAGLYAGGIFGVFSVTNDLTVG
jgi:osmotically-inducible protein OsmY